MSRGPIVNLYYWHVDEVSLILGGTLGPTTKSEIPKCLVYWKTIRMSLGPIVNLYYWHVDEASLILGNLLYPDAEIGYRTVWTSPDFPGFPWIRGYTERWIPRQEP